MRTTSTFVSPISLSEEPPLRLGQLTAPSVRNLGLILDRLDAVIVLLWVEDSFVFWKELDIEAMAINAKVNVE